MDRRQTRFVGQHAVDLREAVFVGVHDNDIERVRATALLRQFIGQFVGVRNPAVDEYDLAGELVLAGCRSR